MVMQRELEEHVLASVTSADLSPEVLSALYGVFHQVSPLLLRLMFCWRCSLICMSCISRMRCADRSRSRANSIVAEHFLAVLDRTTAQHHSRRLISFACLLD
eukprot:m.84956 g.84956  ORF g.84956 m.84956 type:complete len:102 (-) comp14411_c1_seq1:713-1018(-)